MCIYFSSSRLLGGMSEDIECTARDRTTLQHRMHNLGIEIDESEILLTRVSSRLWGQQASAIIMSKLE